MEEELSSSSTEPEVSTSADPLDNGGGVVRQVEEIRLAKSGADPDGDDGTVSREAAAHTGGGDDERDDAGGGHMVASSAASASSAVTATSTATPSRSPTLSPDVAPHPQQQQHRPQTHEPTPPAPAPAPPPAADRADGEGEGDDAPSDEDEDGDTSMGETGSRGGETNGDIEHEPSGEGDDGDGTPSVKQLKGWLADFEKEQQKHLAENRLGSTPSARPPAIRASASVRSDIGSSSAPSSPARKVKRGNGSGSGTPGRLLRKSTSLRVASGEVQATDDGRAPVQTVSAWLTEGDPFHEKRGSKGNVKKLLSSADGVPLVTKVDVTDRKKWLEGAFQKKGKDGGAGSREGSFDCGDSATSEGGERGPRTAAPASDSAEHNHPEEKARGSVKEAARMFGGSVSDAPRRDRVREMREAMERRNEELVRSSDPRNFHKTRWETVSGTTRPSAYKKKITDERGTAPKRSLADLP